MLRNPFRRYVYLGVPPGEEEVYYSLPSRNYNNPIPYENEIIYKYYPFITYPQPEPNYALDDQVITQIAYKILTNIFQYKPKREVEISPITRMRINV